MVGRSGRTGLTVLFMASLTAPLCAQEPKLRDTIKVNEKIVLVLAYSPDGKVLASGGSSSNKGGCPIRLWDTATNKELAVLTGHNAPINGIRFSPDSKVLASTASTEVRLWDVKAGKELFTLVGHTSPAESVSFSPDGKTVATGGIDKSVRIWDAARGKQLTRIDDGSQCVSYTTDGKTLVYETHPSVIKLWDVATGKERAALKTDVQQITSLATSPDGKLIAFSGSRQISTVQWDNTVQLWDMTGKELLRFRGHTSYLHAVVFSPGGKMLATASADKTVRLWSVATGKELAQLAVWTTSVAFSPDGKTLATGGREKAINLWDISDVKDKK